MTAHSTIVPPDWWALTFRTPQQRLLHLQLLATADRDGLVGLDTEQLAPVVGLYRSQAVQAVHQLADAGLLGLYQHAASWWAWLPHLSSWQPTQGALQRPRDPARPPPPREVVQATLGRLWGREATTAEARAACPRAWGRTSSSAASATPAEAEVLAVWEAWRQRQQRPGACRLGTATRRLVSSALREATAKQLQLLVRYAYEADEPQPRFWRGENAQRATYLGLDNLLRGSKLAARLQLALAWLDGLQATATQDDGTTLGPLAAYRARPGHVAGPAPPSEAQQPPSGRTGPAGTTSTSPDGAVRLSRQCRQLLELFVQRGDAGVRTSELAEVARKYTGRISELRGAGADIVLQERDPDGNNLYVMVNATSWGQHGLD